MRRGREVYLSEGCIHCHSQYVRPGSIDERRWGPPGSLKQIVQERPPLLGNRRQGPDLQNVGARRSPEWQRLHLQSPRAVTPGSRMPAYARLFRADDGNDGEALGTYLCSLGADTLPDLQIEANRWRPATAVLPPRLVQQRLFRDNCAACHGATGRGDGALAPGLSRPPRDLTQAGWIFIPRNIRGEGERLALARVAKFGVPGSTMAGREYLSDADVVALAAYVQSMRTAP